MHPAERSCRGHLPQVVVPARGKVASTSGLAGMLSGTVVVPARGKVASLAIDKELNAVLVVVPARGKVASAFSRR